MSMSVRQKELTKKVMCSLLAAGVINVCISGGDVWAAESYKNETIDYYSSGSLGITELTSGSVTIGGDDFSEVIITARNPDSKDATAAGVYVNPGADVKVLGEKINITAINKYDAQRSRAIEFGGASNSAATKLVLGSAGTKSIDLVSHSKGEALGIAVMGGAPSQVVTATINGGLLQVDVSGNDELSDEFLVSGIHVANNTASITRPDTGAALEINTDKTVIKSNGIGLSAYSNGTLKVNGDLEVDAVKAVSARGYSKIEINSDKQHTVKLNGDVEFNFSKGSNSNTSIQADVTINLSNADSYLTGNIVKSGDLEDVDTASKKDVTGMTLGLANDAQWTTDADSFVNKLNLDGGVINITGGAAQTVSVGRVDGSGTVNLATTKINDQLSSGKLAIGTTDLPDSDKTGAAAVLAVNYTGITADDLQNNTNDLSVLAGNISVKNGTNEGLKATAKVAEGLLKGAVSAELVTMGDSGSGGFLTVNTASLQQAKESSTMASMRNIASVAIVACRQ